MKRLLIRAFLWLIVAMFCAALTVMMIATVHAAPQPANGWNLPGHNPYTGSRFAAVMGYRDIPLLSRTVLMMKVIFSQPDVVTVVTRTGISPVDDYVFVDDVRDMHFGRGGTIDLPDRSQWADDHYELTRIWCHDVDCIGSPYVCNNIFRTRRAPAAEQAPNEQSAKVSEVPSPSTAWLLVACVIAAAVVRNRAKG